MYIDPVFRLSVNPTIKNAAARKYERVRAVVVEDRQLKITVKRRAGYWFPIHKEMILQAGSAALI